MSHLPGPLGFPPLDPSRIPPPRYSGSDAAGLDDEGFAPEGESGGAPQGAGGTRGTPGGVPVTTRGGSSAGRIGLLLVVVLLLGAVAWPGTPLGPEAVNHVGTAITRPLQRVAARYLVGAVSDAIEARDFQTAERQLERLWVVADSSSSQPHLLRIRLNLARDDRTSALAAIRMAAMLTEDWRTDLRLVRLASEAADPKLSASMAIQAFVRGADAGTMPELAAAQQRVGNRQAAARILEFGIQIAPTRQLRDSLLALHASLGPRDLPPRTW